MANSPFVTTVALMALMAAVFACLAAGAYDNNNNNDPQQQQQEQQQHHVKYHQHSHRHQHPPSPPPPPPPSSSKQSSVVADEGGSMNDPMLMPEYDTDDAMDSNHFSSDDESGGGGGGGVDGDGLLMTLPSPGSYIPSNCSSCVRREELRRRNLEVIKDQILSKLGMQRAPNMTGRLPPRIPPLDHLLDLYGMQGDAPGSGGGLGGGNFQTGPVYDEEEDDFHARTEKVIAFAQHLPHVRQALKRTESSATKGMESMYFKFSDKVTRSSKVDKAHLWLYIRNQPANQQQHGPHYHHHNHHNHHNHQHPSVGGGSGGSGGRAGGNSTVWIHIYKVVRVPEGESPVLSPVRMTRVALPALTDEKGGKHGSNGGWVSFEVRKVVADWFRWPEENLGLVVHAVHGDASSTSSSSSSSTAGSGKSSTATPPAPAASVPYIVNDPLQADGSLVPFVEVVTTDGRKHRTKRTIGLNCDETSSETRCCRYPLTVDFVEFGWDWIIAPKKYEANYCSGECPYVFLQKYPHTHIVQQANPAGTAGPCCAPRKMSPISMLYFDNEFNIIHGNLPGMVVDRCGCS